MLKKHLFSPDTILYDQEEADPERHWRVTEVVLHELAHQWFGNLVTMKSWSQTWLNEGFATYVSHLGGDILTPDLNSWGRFVAHRNLEMGAFCFFHLVRLSLILLVFSLNDRN